MTKISGSGDIAAQDAVGYDHKAEKKAQAYVNVRVDGSVDDNFKWLQQSDKKIADPSLKLAAGCMEDLQVAIDQAYASGQPNLAKSLESQLKGVEDVLQQLKHVSENPHAPGFVASYAGQLEKVVANVRSSDVMEQVTQGESAAIGSGSSNSLAEATGTQASSGTMSDSELSAFAEHVITAAPLDLANEFADDPKGMWDKLSLLPQEQRQFALMQLQSGTQENNQLFSTLTNFMKAMHDTEKAIVSNLRV